MIKKNHISFLSALILYVFGGMQPIFSQEDIPSKEPEKEIMRVVVVDSGIQGFRAWNDEEEMYQRIKRNFIKVFNKMDWPVTIKFERWSANVPDDGLQLRVWFKSLEEETLNDLVFRAWVNLWEDGEEIADFGIIKVRTYPRLGRNNYDSLEEITSLVAEKIAKKLNEDRFEKS